MNDTPPTTGEQLAMPYADQIAGWRGLAADIDLAILAAERVAFERGQREVKPPIPDCTAHP